MDQFSKSGYIEKNLKALFDYRIKKQDKDMTILVCGAPGNGKSALTWLAAKWMAENIEDVTFDWETVAFTHDQWITNEKDKLPKYAVSWYDEGYNTFYRRNAMKNENREGQSHLNQYRFKHHVRFINFQDISNIETDLLFSNELGVEMVFRCVKQGWMHGLSQRTIQKIRTSKDSNGVKRVKWPTPDFRDTWPDPRKTLAAEWDKYEGINEEKVKESDDEDSGRGKVTCQKCDYHWKPRTDVPRQCPNCNTRKWNPRVR